MSFYDMLLDDLIAKSSGKLDREQTDGLITQAANALDMPTWPVLLAFGQALAAYGGFQDSMQKLVNGAGESAEQIGEVGEKIRRMAEG